MGDAGDIEHSKHIGFLIRQAFELARKHDVTPEDILLDLHQTLREKGDEPAKLDNVMQAFDIVAEMRSVTRGLPAELGLTGL